MAWQDGPNRGNGKSPGPVRRGRGFAPAGGFVGGQMRAASASRGIAEARLLTAWDEIVGPEIAAVSRPVRISHSSKDFGGTLLLVVAPGRGPELMMQAPEIEARVNACFGYRAVARLRLTQTAGAGFAEGATPFDRTGAQETPALPAAVQTQISALTAGISDPDLRGALDRLGSAVARKRRQT